MSWFIVDVEADGLAPGKYSMVCFGAIMVTDNPKTAPYFYGRTRPISLEYDPEALAISGFTRDQHEGFEDPEATMYAFAGWILSVNKPGSHPVFVSDNLAYDYQWINYYFINYTGRNPFGHSGRRIGDLYAGLRKNAHDGNSWKRWRVTPHTHNPVDDARGNLEALLRIRDELGLKLSM